MTPTPPHRDATLCSLLCYISVNISASVFNSCTLWGLEVLPVMQHSSPLNFFPSSLKAELQAARLRHSTANIAVTISGDHDADSLDCVCLVWFKLSVTLNISACVMSTVVIRWRGCKLNAGLWFYSSGSGRGQSCVVREVLVWEYSYNPAATLVIRLFCNLDKLAICTV